MPVSDELRERLEACTDLDTLAHWLQRAAKVDQADDVFEGEPRRQESPRTPEGGAFLTNQALSAGSMNKL